MDVELAQFVLRSSIACAASSVLVLALCHLVRRWFGALTAYRLWLIVPLAMAASLMPQPVRRLPILIPVEQSQLTEALLTAPSSAPFNWLVLIWAAGVVLSFLIVAGRQFQFVRILGKSSLDSSGLPILRTQDGFSVGPAVVGVISPRIVLPADFESRYTAEEQRVILAHERAHLFSHDAQANAIAALLQCLNWFNPLAHIAAFRFRVDQELAADAAVVAQFPQHERVYAEALLKTQMAARSLPLGCQWPSRSEHPLRKRVSLLNNRPAYRPLASLALASLAIVTTVTAWAAPPHFELVGFGAQPVVLWTVVKAPNAPPADPQPTRVSSGSWTRLSFQLPDGTAHNIRLSPTVLASGRVLVRTIVEDRGTSVEVTPLFLKGSEPGVVRLGAAGLVITASTQE